MNTQTVTHHDLSLVLVSAAHELECKDLMHNYGIKPHHLNEYINDQMIPKVDSGEEYTVIAVDFPFVEMPGEKENTTKTLENDKEFSPLPIPSFLFSQSEKRRIRTAHTMIFVGKDFVIVLHDEKSSEITNLFHHIQGKLKVRETIMGYGSYYLAYCIISELVRNAYNVMRGITNMIENIDIHVIEKNAAAEIVEDISLTRRNIVFFRSMIDQSVSLFSEIANGKHPQFSSSTHAHWNSIHTHLQKIRNRLHRSQELLEGIAKSHESLITVRTNEIVKVLTLFTAILLPLTLITGFYGMNVTGLPMSETIEGLKHITIIMVVLAATMMVFFKAKKWF